MTDTEKLCEAVEHLTALVEELITKGITVHHVDNYGGAGGAHRSGPLDSTVHHHHSHSHSHTEHPYREGGGWGGSFG